MYGAIAGDTIGSVHEWIATKTTEFPLFVADSSFTDDTVLTVAVAEHLLTGGDLTELLKQYTRRYRGRGYGGRFGRWAHSDSREPYGSFGNGSAMRASPAGWAAGSLEEALELGRRSAAPTHDHPEGIKGAQAVAVAIYLARTGASRDAIREALVSRFHYDLHRRVDDIRPAYKFDETCQGSVPEALVAFLESRDWEHSVRLSISLGGDADTLACITGSVAEAFYGGVPPSIREEALARLDPALRATTEAFAKRFGVP